MTRVNKNVREAQLQQIWRMLLDNKTTEEIAIELNVSSRTIQRLVIELDKRYGEVQRKKTDDTLYVECNLFKNRMLTLYRGLENIVIGVGHNGLEKAKCAEVAANICIDILKMESEVIKSVRDIKISIDTNDKANRLLGDVQQGQGGSISEENSRSINLNNVVSRDLDDPEETC